MANKTIMPPDRMETVKLKNGFLARPACCMGTAGFYPCAWVAAVADSADKAVRDFYTINTNIVESNDHAE